MTLCVLPLSAQLTGEAPDPVSLGPYQAATGEYRLPARVHPDVLPDEVTELWAKTHYPVDAPGPLPVLFFLHGNHSTCGSGINPRVDTNCRYTNEGVCPDGFVVVPNHEGYDYIAQPLASWGYVVVSINANRGINCATGVPGDTGLNKARGRLILKHLELVSQWNLGLVELPMAFPPQLAGRLDYQELGLLGHSRGGEGARAAYNFYQDPGSLWVEKILQPVDFQAIFEIAAVDGQTDQVFDATGVSWNQMLPMCDGDVSDLSGIQPMDRMMSAFTERPPRSKSSYTVWGANHNFFNTEWQTSDSNGCVDHEPLPAETSGSAAQRLVGRSAVMAMFRGAVGPRANRSFLFNFNPAYRLPESVVETTRVDRGFVDTPRGQLELPLEDFSQATGTNRWGFANNSQGVSYTHAGVPDHDASLRAAQLSWNDANAGRLLQINVAPPGEGRAISRFSTLDFRVSRQTTQPDFSSTTDLSVSLVHADGLESVRVPLSNYGHLTGPVGGTTFFGDLRHPILQTIRIPLIDFRSGDLSRLRGVRFTFDVPNPGETADDGGAIHLADVRLSVVADQPTTLPAMGELEPVPLAMAGDLSPGTGLAPAFVSGVETLVQEDGGVEITVVSTKPFPVTDALPTLQVGEISSQLSRYSEDTHALTFWFPGTDLESSGEAELRLGGRGTWQLGWVELESDGH